MDNSNETPTVTNETPTVKEKILLAGKDGKTDLREDFSPLSSGDMQKKIDAMIVNRREELSMNKNFDSDLKAVYTNLTERGIFDKDGDFNETTALVRGNTRDLKAWSVKNPSLLLEVADNGKTRCYERTNRYEDVGESFVKKRKLETADASDSDRILGIPYAQAMAGDRVYIINGKVFTGWALYYSLTSIKSPEDYARNVDLVYNVPYLFGSNLLKAQLGVGVGFETTYGDQSNKVAEEKLIEKYLFQRLRIGSPLLIKTGFHLETYGNAYWALRRDHEGVADKLTILQPERIKIFLDPMTTKILFYIYLPPIIGGTTIASYPSTGKVNPNILTGVTLSYPTPIVLHPEDVLHFKINDFTEYPFGFSSIKSCLEPAMARLDVNILSPIIFKKYTKPMIHWQLNTEGVGPRQIDTKKTEMVDMLENMEPGSDPVTTDRWNATVINIAAGKEDIFKLTSDMDTQMFAATGVPETYFKPLGSTDRMISEQDKTFLARLKIPQEIVGQKIEDQLIKPRIYHELQAKKKIRAFLDETDVVEEILETYDSWMASEPKYPKVVWKEVFKEDETQKIANTIAKLTNQIIDVKRAAMILGEIPPEGNDDTGRVGIDDPIMADAKMGPEKTMSPMDSKIPPPFSSNNMQENMEALRGGNNVMHKKDTSSRNIHDVKDPTQLGGSRYAQHETKGEKGDIQEKSKHGVGKTKLPEVKNDG